jgi:hypothetical protein
MVRGLVLGSLAFAATFALERQFGSLTSDLARYDRMRAMSGDPPFWREQLDVLLGKLTTYAKTNPKTAGVVDGLKSDVLRYLRMRSM